MQAAMDDKAGGQRQSDPTILDQSIIYSRSQDSLTTSGMVAAPSDEFHRASYISHVSADIQSLDKTRLTVRSTMVVETLFSKDDCLGSGRVVQVDDRTRRGDFSRIRQSSIRHELD